MNGLGSVLKLIHKHAAITKADTAGPSCFKATILVQIEKVLNNSSCLSCVPPELDTDDKPDTTKSRRQDSTSPAVQYTLSQRIKDVNMRHIPAFLRTSPFKEQDQKRPRNFTFPLEFTHYFHKVTNCAQISQNTKVCDQKSEIFSMNSTFLTKNVKDQINEPWIQYL